MLSNRERTYSTGLNLMLETGTKSILIPHQPREFLLKGIKRASDGAAASGRGHQQPPHRHKALPHRVNGEEKNF